MPDTELRDTLDPLFWPKSVAVIGASDRELTIGYRIIRNLLDVKFCGPVYPVNPKAAAIQELPCYPSILEVPGEVELAHIVVKNTLVPGVLADCARKGVRVAVVNTAGFKEIGPEGAELERELVRISQSANIRVFGPNCQGIINTDPAVNAYCNFTFTKAKPGHISIFSQSGGVGEVVNNRLVELGEGLRMYASSGNVCDIQCQDILDYWGEDPNTRVIICHLEYIRDPERFMRITKAVSRTKPVLVMYTGQTEVGARAVSYHTGGMIKDWEQERVVLEESGALLLHSIEEICQTARAFVHLPMPRGNRVAIITNTGGPGVIAVDALLERDCEVPELGEATKVLLRKVLHPEAIVVNPIDVLATADPDHFGAALSAMIEDPAIDSILLNFITPFFVDCESVARKIVAILEGSMKPAICAVMTDKRLWASTLEIFRAAEIPTYDLPELAARTLAMMTRYALRDSR